jgi:hypothetical protein
MFKNDIDKNVYTSYITNVIVLNIIYYSLIHLSIYKIKWYFNKITIK